MPDKTLQEIIANKLGKNIDELTPDLLSESDLYLSPFASYISGSIDDKLYDVLNFSGLEYINSVNIILETTSLDALNIKNYPDVCDKTTILMNHNLDKIFPKGIDFSDLGKFHSVDIDPHNTYKKPPMVTLNQNNYTEFFISFDEMEIYNFPTSEDLLEGSMLSGQVPVSIDGYYFYYDFEFLADGVQFNLANPETFDYSKVVNKTAITTEDTFPDGPYAQVYIQYGDEIHMVHGIINFCIDLKFVEASDLSTVTAEYWEYDTAGNPVKKIAEDEPFTGEVGTDYTTTQKNIPGYTFVKVAGEPTGKYAEKDVTVTYIYKKKTPSTPSEPNNPGTPGSVPDEVLLPVWRAYNFGDGDHLYTISRDEYDWIVGLGWQAEEIAFYSVTPAYEKAIPAYRLYNPNSGEHFYTLSEAEYEAVAAKGWNKEGIGYYMVPENLGYAIYRVFNPNATGPGSHLFTKSREEADWLISLGWEDEGIAFYSAR
ncbi:MULTISPECIES: MucBP domain-containing protein [unclassified Enterococcus]|uniref:MucBP domain-containing protein n=1 Tax=unclassified Enterococcus TaxID=2608891 RepID=UPI002474AA54|nr:MULTISPECIES: MucBP domain-containing protein [unclassified Enterococcus]